MSAIEIAVSISGAEQFVSADAGDLVQRIGLALAQRMADATLDATRPLVPVDTGLLKSSGAVEPTSDGAVLRFDVPYSAEVEQGGPPRTVALDELQGWSSRHGIPAWLVQKAIEARGTRAQPYLAPGLAEAQAGFPQMATDAANELRQQLAGGS